MKTILILSLVILNGMVSWLSLSAQDISNQRSHDNNTALAVDSTDWKLHRIIKEITLQKGTGTLLSVGGEVREQLRYFKHVNFGDVDSGVSDRDLYVQHRFMLHADLMVNSWLRLFSQLNSGHVTGKNTLSPQVDRDDLGIIQAFAEIRFPVPFPLQLRLGRQEFLFGNDRMLGLRDGPTVRQSFDGVRLTLGLEGMSGDFFVVQPVYYKFGVFDNTRRRQEYVMSGYWTMPLKGNNFLDVYYFGVRFPNSAYANDTASENRHSAGLRLYKTTGFFTYDCELTYQSGKFGHQQIRAWQYSSQVAYHWQELSWKPKLLIREALYTGDREPSGSTMNTFRPVSTKSPVHDLVQIGSANLFLISTEAEAVLYEKIIATVRYLAVWRFSAKDGMYPPDVRKMTRATDMPGTNLGKHITNGLVVEFSYTPNKHLNILAFGGIFTAGEYIRNSGEGKNMEAFSIRATYKL